MSTNEILARAHSVAGADLTASTARHEAVSARQRGLGDTTKALDRYIAAAEVRVARLPSSEAVASQTALAVAADPANAVNAILTAVEAARVEREQAIRDLGAMLAARKALYGALRGLDSEAAATHRALVAAQAAARNPVAANAHTDEQLMAVQDVSSLSGVERQRIRELHALAARYELDQTAVVAA